MDEWPFIATTANPPDLDATTSTSVLKVYQPITMSNEMSSIATCIVRVQLLVHSLIIEWVDDK
jgi:hypothetical protein